jgi:hypothetical protein
MFFRREYYLIAAFFLVLFSSCKKWDDSQINNADLTLSLSAAIASDPNLSTFSNYLRQTGVDAILQSSKTFTVWAPNNTALQSLDASIVNDTAKLRAFVMNHISYQTYFTRDVQTSVRVPMLSGKYNNFFGNKIEDANVVTADRFVSNGVLHVIDKPMVVLQSAWEYVQSTTSQYAQNSYIANLNFNSFSPSLAIVDSISALTGLPIYRPGTGIVVRNFFNDRVFDLKREDKQYTYFLLANAAFNLKADSLKPYYQTGFAAATDSLDRWNIVKDLVVDTLYPTAASLPASITSKFGIVVPINKASIIETRKLSNGVVYVLSSSDVSTASKFKEIRIEGEKPFGFLSDKTSSTNYRIRLNPVTNQNYSDLLVSGHGVTGYYSYYRLTEMPSMKYNVYALAVNDFQTAAVFESIIPVVAGTSTVLPTVSTQLATNTTQLSYAVPLNTATGAYNEVFLGSFTSNAYGTLDIRLTSAGSTLGSSGTGPIVLDYLRIVPVP